MLMLPPTTRSQSGFTYLGILLAVALLGTGLAAMGTLWSTQSQRTREQQLLDVGLAYQRAIASYYNVTPRGAHEYPTSLQSLVRDDRNGKVVRHLRELYPDPVTGSVIWHEMRLPEGTIFGVASTSQRTPLKQANFPSWALSFEDRGCICDWQFAHLPQLAETSAIAQ